MGFSFFFIKSIVRNVVYMVRVANFVWLLSNSGIEAKLEVKKANIKFMARWSVISVHGRYANITQFYSMSFAVLSRDRFTLMRQYELFYPKNNNLHKLYKNNCV